MQCVPQAKPAESRSEVALRASVLKLGTLGLHLRATGREAFLLLSRKGELHCRPVYAVLFG